jgi:GAF domain-containing protein
MVGFVSDDRERAVLRFAGVDRVADFCGLGVRRAGADGMAVMWVDRFDSLESVFATDSVAERIAELEFTFGEGPGHASLRSKKMAGCDDLAAAEAGQLWPAFAPDATAAGVRAIHAFPLISLARVWGVVSLYRHMPGGLSREQTKQAATVTELIGMALIDPDSEAIVGSGLRMTVHQAAGMVMVQTGSSTTSQQRSSQVVAGSSRWRQNDDIG